MCSFFLFSCQPVAMLIYGIKKPSRVSIMKIEQKAASLGLDTSMMYCIKPEIYPKFLNELKSLPNIRIYDKAGNLHNYRENPEECKSTAEYFIRNLRRDAPFTYNRDSSFYLLPQQLEGLQKQPFFIETLPAADYYIVVFWATFLGKLNKDYVVPWVSQAKNNYDTKIQLINVNCDLRKE